MKRNKRKPSTRTLGKKFAPTYSPSVGTQTTQSFWFLNKPTFNPTIHVELMLRDPRISFGSALIKGMIRAVTQIRILEPNTKIRNFIAEQIATLWFQDLEAYLTCVDFGWYCGEVMYRKGSGGLMHYDCTRTIHQTDAVPLSCSGELWGLRIETYQQSNGEQIHRNIPNPKAVWIVRQPFTDKWWGRSRLRGAFFPWINRYESGGTIESMQVLKHKYGISGDKIYYPPGRDPHTNATNLSLAMTAAALAQSGGVKYIPNKRDDKGERLWEWEDGGTTSDPSNILMFLDREDQEIFDGLHIPEEVVEAASSGSGFSGRSIPFSAFITTCLGEINDILSGFDQQVIRPLIRLGFGIEPTHKIFAIPPEDEDPDEKEDGPDSSPGTKKKPATTKAANPKKSAKPSTSVPTPSSL